MTKSLEVLDNVVFAAPEEYDTIKKDLEVLEILKKHLSIKSFTPYEYPELIILSGGEMKDAEETKKIKEWLENDELKGRKGE